VWGVWGVGCGVWLGVEGTLCWIERKGGWNCDDGLWGSIILVGML